MKLDSTFTVTAPIEEVWKTLMDFEQVAGCVPGAQVLNALSEDAYQVAMKVKLGPVTMQYKGQMEVVERDEREHRAVLKGQAKEARGQGTASATAVLSLVEEAGLTRGTVAADVSLSGRAAAMGQGVIGSVTDQMMTQFADNLQAMLDAGPSGAAAPAAPPLADDVLPPLSAPAAEVPRQEPRHEVRREPLQADVPTAGTDSLDALSLARGMVQDQLRQPERVVQVLAVVALLAYRLGRLAGRRSGRREARRWMTPPLG
jgi:carbon monoxide dehydrogenase subunit G